MQLRLYAYFLDHPMQMWIVKRWVKAGLPVPSFIKLQLANDIHAEMIARLMSALIEDNGLSLERALKVHFEMGTEFAAQVKDFLSIDPDDARSLARIIDFLHGALFISGKDVVRSSRNRAISHWHKCPLSSRLAELKEEGGPYYCHLYQEMYKGVLYGINRKARANDLVTTRSQGCGYCVLETWIE
jgi:hypothetical protein